MGFIMRTILSIKDTDDDTHPAVRTFSPLMQVRTDNGIPSKRRGSDLSTDTNPVWADDCSGDVCLIFPIYEPVAVQGYRIYRAQAAPSNSIPILPLTDLHVQSEGPGDVINIYNCMGDLLLLLKALRTQKL
jgi:hypothetical protein